MNIIKIQQGIIKDLLNYKRGEYFIQIKEGKVYIMTRFQMFILSSKEFILDIDKLGLSNTNIADSLLKSAMNAMPAVKTPVLRILCGKTCIELKQEDNGELVYVDQTLLKFYDKKCDFKVINAKSPVFIYESDVLVGLVLPVKVG